MSTPLNRHRGDRQQGRLEVLDRAECVDLLSTTKVGRIAYTGRYGPRVVPLNHVVHNRAVWLTTSATSELVTHNVGEVVAYEADHIEDFFHGGWSVEAVGTLEICHGSFNPMTFEPAPDSWVESADDVLLQIYFHTITGRRLHPAGSS